MMKKFSVLFLFFYFVGLPVSFADSASVKRFQGNGEVVSVDPVYSRITINHSLIKDFAHDGETEFVVSSPALLKKISKSDLVSFDIEETRGDAQIVKIERTGQAPPKEEGIGLGRAAQDVLEGAGAVVKTVASPIAPIGQVANATADATTNTTGSVLSNTDGDMKKKF